MLPVCRSLNSLLDKVRRMIHFVFTDVSTNNDKALFYRARIKGKKTRGILLLVHRQLRRDTSSSIAAVRVAPTGVPLLLVSACDASVSNLVSLVNSAEQVKEMSERFEQICGSNDVKTIDFAFHTDEGFALFRYLLRVNSTKMRQSAWQSKNLPR